MPTSMLAIVQRRYGTSDVLQLREVDRPGIGDDDVRIRVGAASLHIGDWHVMAGFPYMLRVVGFGLLAPKVKVRGMDVAGTVDAVGRNVTRFRPGDDVFGTCEGAFAEFASASHDNFAMRPARLTCEQAATVPTSGFAALQALRDRGAIQPGQKVLIAGASGGVGLFAIQMAKAFGAHVTGVCSATKADLVMLAGADRVVDYAAQDFTRGSDHYDLVLDLGGNRSLSDLRRLLTPTGILVLVGGEGGTRWLGGTDRWLQALLLAPFTDQKLRPLASNPCRADLERLRQFVDDGQLTPIIDRVFSLRDVPQAFTYLKTGAARGKLVIRVGDSPHAS